MGCGLCILDCRVASPRERWMCYIEGCKWHMGLEGKYIYFNFFFFLSGGLAQVPQKLSCPCFSGLCSTVSDLAGLNCNLLVFLDTKESFSRTYFSYCLFQFLDISTRNSIPSSNQTDNHNFKKLYNGHLNPLPAVHTIIIHSSPTN